MMLITTINLINIIKIVKLFIGSENSPQLGTHDLHHSL